MAMTWHDGAARDLKMAVQSPSWDRARQCRPAITVRSNHHVLPCDRGLQLAEDLVLNPFPLNVKEDQFPAADLRRDCWRSVCPLMSAA